MKHTNVRLESFEDPLHPILPEPWAWEIVRINYEIPDAPDEAFVDLTFSRGRDRRTLRFLGPRDLEITHPLTTHGLAILDVSARGLDRLNVRVADFEALGGGIRFWARDVVEYHRSGAA